jgi:hypothetical protein
LKEKKKEKKMIEPEHITLNFNNIHLNEETIKAYFNNTEYDIITCVHLHDVTFTEKSFQPFCEAIKALGTVTQLLFSGVKQWRKEKFDLLFETIKDMKELDLLQHDARLSENFYNPEDDAMITALRTNAHYFTQLRIRDASVHPTRLLAIAEALKTNTRLKDLSIVGYEVPFEVMEAFNEVLRLNSTLTEVNFPHFAKA